MRKLSYLSPALCFSALICAASEEGPAAFPLDPLQSLERTCFQTGQGWSPAGNLRSDVAIVYGIDKGLPERIESWRDHGYRIHVMTGVSWGSYQDYLYGRFDGINHEDEAQTEANGHKISHGGDVYYMCPGTNYGKFLCVGVQRALDAGAEAIHLEEPEFWARGGYSEGFKREWKSYYGEDWQPPHSSVNARWRSAKLKYFLYRRALQQVFDYVQDYNRRTGRKVRCYVPTHSLLNYAHWQIVSPESSLAQLHGCDGYIAQVWTGTSRTPNMYGGELRERTFETAFLEYGAMQNLVRATGRGVWYLNDPVEDNPNHDWDDYRRNWESTLVASLLQPDVWQYEVAPWPERIFAGKYPRHAGHKERESIPSPYATELQTVMNALNDMKQSKIEWDCGTRGFGVLVSDSLMFQRGGPEASDPHLSEVYGLALPLLKRGIPITPVQLENTPLKGYLSGFRVLLLSYRGQKPLGPEPHSGLAAWVKQGGTLMVVDDDSDPFNQVTEWWNSGSQNFKRPRQHLFGLLGLQENQFKASGDIAPCGKGAVMWLRENPARLASIKGGPDLIVKAAQELESRQKSTRWLERNYLMLRRGPYVIAAGLDESVPAEPRILKGRLVNLFDPELQLLSEFKLAPDSRALLVDVGAIPANSPRLVAAACKAMITNKSRKGLQIDLEGLAETQGILLLAGMNKPIEIQVSGKRVETYDYDSNNRLLRVRFANTGSAERLSITY